MSITNSNLINNGGAPLPPTPIDTLYWRECHRLESRWLRHYRQPDNPELQSNIAAYWSTIRKELQHDNLQKSA